MLVANGPPRVAWPVGRLVGSGRFGERSNYDLGVAYQSLYRRYRPGRFADLVGQQHVVSGLRNAVRDGRTGHAYLFSGPRGTGKTSTARILAKALNCTELTEGEPCGVCEACRSIEAGTSYDLFELDAASNNKVEDVRDLISRVAIGSPGRTKVYILDEVHMLSTAASNALLKTLEEPPDHVAFVLATTDPQKVLPTIRSRTQHFEFGLVPAGDLERHVRWVIEDAGLHVDDDAVSWVVRKGAGSVRDALSALDQVAAVGGVSGVAAPLDELLEALCERDGSRALIGLATALAAGREPRLVAEELLGRLRDAFLAAMAPGLSQLPELDAARMADVAKRLGPAGVTRALETIGAAVLEMRQAPDARVALEVALIRLTRAELDSSVAALTERIARLEAALASGALPTAAPPTTGGPAVAAPPDSTASPLPSSTAATAATDAPIDATAPMDRAARPAVDRPDGEARPPAPSRRPPAEAAPDAGQPPSRQTPPSVVREGAAAAARRQLAARTGNAPGGPPGRPPTTAPPQRQPPAAAPPTPTVPSGMGGAPPNRPLRAVPDAPGPEPVASAAPAAAAPAGPGPGADAVLTVAELTQAWSAGVLDDLPPGARALYRAGQFVGVEGGVALFALPSRVHRDRCEAKASDVERSLAAHFGRPVPLRLVVEDSAARADRNGPALAEPDVSDDVDYHDIGDARQLEDAPSVSTTGLDLLQQTFPGAEVIE